MPDLSGRILGEYELLEAIGRGGMAAVYRARHAPTGRIVAVKILSPQAAENESFLLRFRREARVVYRLQHPHIVPVEAFGEVGDYAFLVMPYLRVGSLADRLAQGPLTPQEGGRILSQVCSALDYAHQQGVVHRDVKPSNILLDEAGNALLADFGLAQIHDASISLTGSALLGTPAYVSPEQVRGELVDARSDQYSLGIVLYQLTTGKLPYEAETPMAVLLKQVNDPMPRPRLVNSNIPESVERVILKATAKEPADRFASMEAMNAAFQAALAHALNPRLNPAPTIILPPSVSMTSALPRKRRRFVPWMAAAAFLLLLACPLAATLVSGDTPPTPTPADGSAPRLTDAAATINALSTEIVAARAGPMSAGDVGTAAAATILAAATTASPETPTVTGTATGITATQATLSTANTGSPTVGTSTPRPSPTAASTASRTLTPTPSGSGTPPATSTATRTPTGPIPSLTLTLIPTLPLPSPTSTSTATPAPTVTADVLVCDTSSLAGFSVNGAAVSVGLHNDGDSYIRITGIVVDWPALNGGLLEIHLGGETIWSNGDLLPPTAVTSGWDSPNRIVQAGQAEPLTFVFQLPARPSGYSLSVQLNNECSLSAGN